MNTQPVPYEIEHNLPPCCGLKPTVFQSNGKPVLLIVECGNLDCPHDNHYHPALLVTSNHRAQWEKFRVATEKD